MRYFGSKASTVEAVANVIGPPRSFGLTFCDPFGGVAVVGSHFKRLGYTVTCGDVLAFANYFQTARISLSAPPRFTALRAHLGGSHPIDALNAAPPVASWVHREFAERRRYFTPANARKIDGARRLLDGWRRDGLLPPMDDAYLYAALIDSVDRIANTAGTYYAHLKGWTRRALHSFEVRPVVAAPGPAGSAVLADATEVVRQQAWDVLYLDPPYNGRNHLRYYHLPETLATGRHHAASGASGIPAGLQSGSSPYYNRAAGEALARLVEGARFGRLIVHYSDQGWISADDIRDVLRGLGSVEEVEIDAVGYRTTSGSRAVRHRLYLVS